MLEQILSGEATETVVEQIHEYLTTIGENVRAGKMPLDDFIVFKVRCEQGICDAFELTIFAAFRQKPRGIRQSRGTAARSSRYENEGEGWKR